MSSRSCHSSLPTSGLLDFYRGDGRDGAGRFLSDVWAFSDEELEVTHDFIQWLFPLPEPSRFVRDVPLLTDEDVLAFRSDPELLSRVLRSADLMRGFYARTQAWRRPSDHNHARITRILRFLALLGLEAEAQQLFAWFDVEAGHLPTRTRWFWQEAMRPRPAWLAD